MSLERGAGGAAAVNRLRASGGLRRTTRRFVLSHVSERGLLKAGVRRKQSVGGGRRKQNVELLGALGRTNLRGIAALCSQL